MAYDSNIQTGSFVADGNMKTLKLRSGLDRLVVENQTEWIASNNGAGFRYTWYSNLGSGMLKEYHPAADHTSAVDLATNAIQVVDSASASLGAAIAVTAGTNAVQPSYTVASSANLKAGMIVRITGSDQKNLNGLDFSISISDGTHFELENTLATAPGVVAGANGVYRIVGINVESYNLFAPSLRNISDISKAASAVVTTLVDHDFKVGQLIKFKVPSVYGMTELDGLTGAVTAVTASTFTVDVNSTGFTAFTFPIFTDVPFDLAVAVPVGDAKSSVNQLTPSKFYNQGYVGVVLYPGAALPAGRANDVIRWTAYKSVRVDDE